MPGFFFSLQWRPVATTRSALSRHRHDFCTQSLRDANDRVQFPATS